MPTTVQTIPAANHQTFLIEQNIESIDRALRLLEQLDDDAYRSCPASLAPHRVGGHIRHILEFYECFLEGLVFSHVDYDARRRDESVETSRTVAMERLRSVRQRLRDD